MLAPFEASRLKLERAAKHAQELEGSISAYLNERPCRIIVEKYPGMELSRDTRGWIARIQRPIPISLSAVIGDVVHNLRASLDLIMCDLVRLNGGSLDKVHFPFCAKASELDKAISDRKIRRAGDDVVQVVRNLKPYAGGNDALRAIHDMDVADKHTMLLPVLGAVTLPLRGILGQAIPEQLANFSTLIVKDGQIVIGTPGSVPIPLGTELPARFFLAFGEGRGFGRRPVIESLHELAQTADGVVNALASLRPGAAFPRPTPTKPARS